MPALLRSHSTAQSSVCTLAMQKANGSCCGSQEETSGIISMTDTTWFHFFKVKHEGKQGQGRWIREGKLSRISLETIWASSGDLPGHWGTR